MYSNSEILSLFYPPPLYSQSHDYVFHNFKRLIFFLSSLFLLFFCFRKMFLNNGWTGNISQHDFGSKLLTACFFFSPSSIVLLFYESFFLLFVGFFCVCGSSYLEIAKRKSGWDGKRDGFKRCYWIRNFLRRFTSNHDVFFYFLSFFKACW